MRICHTADLHIGCCRRYPDSLKRAKIMLDALLQIIQDERCDFLVVSGDWFDRPTPSHDERALVADLFDRCPVPIVSITGNHDNWGRDLSQTALNWLSGLAPKLNHRVWDTPTSEGFNGIWWIALPHHRWNTPEMHLLTSFYISQIPNDWEGPVVALAHEFFQGAALDGGFVGASDKYTKLPVFSQDITYWALGDVHAMQKLGSNAWYPGAPYQTNFGEKLSKGVLVVDLEKGPLKRPVFHEIKGPTPLVELTEVPEIWPDAYVKLTVRPEDLPHPLPSCVVQVGSTSLPADSQAVKEVHTLVSSKFLLDGMREFLERKEWPEDMVKRGMHFAHELVKRFESE